MSQTEKKTIMVTGGKETFLIRSLMKKLEENRVSCFYSEASIDTLSKDWQKADLITYYLDKGEQAKKDVVIYLNDQLMETNKRIVVIGDRDDTFSLTSNISEGLILETYYRPLDIDKYLSKVSEYFSDGGAANTKSILIIDDDPTYMGVIRGWLRDYYKVSMVTSGTQALTWLAKNHADLILLDYEMPVVSGPQVLEMLRSEPEYRHIPVFFLTGKSDKESVMSVLALKPQNYLLKTITQDDLLFELGKFFEVVY